MLNQPVIFLATANPIESRSFYENKIGLNFVSSDPYALVFDIGESTLRIQIVDSVIDTPYTSLGWAVKDIMETVHKLNGNGVIFESYENLEQDKYKIWHSPNSAKIAWFKDPDNNILSITEHNSV